ncbi:tannase/feruloyl esterase family alpha/beta hydrolase [Tanticharoenia sakaeratensis]|uniref:Feruloyl esterase n=1 Tax=Tanticharoenia sakaeratensis NBRC 103193 TaxID=1231623 RepID=A0A0D6MKZ7_9PROT|nr:tannase/feruloyl esterase family alpha/beta hydrolase [Tanticharoenia sakaeratensis]GAN54151.1 feruloyl esterase [Tanticharoenia sakaeratensis NBRC 103193]GBQ19449.1 hypothetical protein AA103193_1032 [Tanticharoenia sakaeratensis NBRC 103193]
MIFPGPAKGSEDGFSADGRAFPVALDLFKYAAFQNPGWDWTTLNWDTDVAKATAKLGPLLHVDDDLTPFFRHGGKLLMYIGWNDGHNPEELIGYYRSLMRRAGPCITERYAPHHHSGNGALLWRRRMRYIQQARRDQ